MERRGGTKFLAEDEKTPAGKPFEAQDEPTLLVLVQTYVACGNLPQEFLFAMRDERILT
ncbi:MAG TPA: hypothetical protein VGJ06_00595 [Candidatus Acidoferrum sp.]|jgi:hypothetical protein